MPALTAIIGGNAKPLKRELDDVMRAAKNAGMTLNTNLNPNVRAGAIRELLVLLREIGRGNWTRVPGSISILADRLGALKFLLNPITGIVLGLVAGFAAAYKLSSYLVNNLSGLKMPEIHLDYIAKYLQASNAALEAQKEINREVSKTVDLYGSVVKQAERFADVNKEHFGHERKMLEYQEQKELKKAGSEEQRAQIRAKYSDKNLELNKRERDAELQLNQWKVQALNQESANKKQQGDSIRVRSKQADEQDVRIKKQQADAAQKYLDEMDKQNEPGFNKEKAIKGFMRGYNAVAASGVTGKDLDAAEQANKEEARRRIQDYRNAVDRQHDNDVLRQRKDELYKGAADSASKAAEQALTNKSTAALNQQKNKDEKEEADAKLDAENAGQTKIMHGKLTGLQQVGAFVASPVYESLQRQSVHLLGKIEQHLSKSQKNGASPRPFGGVHW